MSDEFITTDEFIRDNYRSPPLQPTHPNYDNIETPPPIDISDDEYDSDVTETTGDRGHVWRSRSSKGPNYPEVASKASIEFFTLSPEAACEDRRPSTAAEGDRMLDGTYRRVSATTEQGRVLAHAAYKASEKLNAAIQKDGRDFYHTNILQSSSTKSNHQVQVYEIEPDSIEVSNGIHRTLVESNYMMAHPPPSEISSPKSLNVKPPPKVSLPAIRTRNAESQGDWSADQNNSIATSPALAKFTITPVNGNHEQQLPRMQTSPSRSIQGNSPRAKQTLPSLETALGQISATEGNAYSAHSSAISRPSPGQYTHFGPSPSSYSTHSPASAISPPRLPTNPSFWRTTGHETSNSTPSDQTSAAPSAGISTPATSYFGHSPTNSVNTPGTMIQDNDNMSAVSASSSQLTDGSNQYNGNYGSGVFKCTFPECNAAPFGTQYLLNSHANVHSNTRPHFCPVQGCPRGPGGQGFKRKNEMIRHGLVHQSPGYVCPFCPDQQHKYPRPDNLQRHVRVHHVDKDRDDPLLREVLAQRPEGPSRGRRRRLGYS